MIDYLTMDKLEKGCTYKISARNSNVGIWKPENKSFIILREKFGERYLFEEYHYDTGVPYGTAMPLDKLDYPVIGEDEGEQYEHLERVLKEVNKNET